MKLKLLFSVFALYAPLILIANTQLKPTPVKDGINQAIHENNEDCWFSYKPVQSKYLIISSCGKTDIDTYCEVYFKNTAKPFLRSDDECNTQSELRFIAIPDSSYLIRWRGIYASESYNWSCVEEDIPEGEHFSSAIPIELGKITSDITYLSEKWYKYSSTDNVFLKLKYNKADITIYTDKVDDKKPTIQRSTYLGDSLFFSTIKGETYYINWRNKSDGNEPENWFLTKEIAAEGQAYSNPAPLPLNTQIERNLQNRIDAWYHFQSDSFGLLKIEKNGYSDLHIDIIDKSTNSRVIPSYEEPRFNSAFFSFKYKKNVDYLIRIRNSYYINFIANARNFMDGENIIAPITVQKGVHKADTHGIRGQYFIYTPTSNQQVSISTEFNTYITTIIQLLNEQGNTILASDTCANFNDAQAKILYSVVANTPYLIYIGRGTYSSESVFRWDLRENPDSCSNATTVNHNEPTTLTGNTEYWFKYTTKQSCQLTVVPSDLKKDEKVDFSIYADCDSLLSTNKFTILDSNTTVLIKIRGYRIENNYDFSIVETHIPKGSEVLPILIDEGQHTSARNQTTWYKYIAKTNGKVEVDVTTFAGLPPRVEIYRMYRGGLMNITQSYIFKKAASRTIKGEPIYIKWLNSNMSEEFNWSLSEKVTEEGDIIEKAIEAHEGINLMQKLNRMSSWYYYVPKYIGELEISSCNLTNEDTYISVWDSIGQNGTRFFNDNYCNKQSMVRLISVPNDTLYFNWYEDYVNTEFNYSITEFPYQQGDYKKNPIEAVVGKNNCDFTTNNKQWFRYVAQSDGRFIISTCEFNPTFKPSLTVYKDSVPSEVYTYQAGCGDGNNSYRFKSQVNCKKGSTYFIAFDIWKKDETKQFDWSITEEPYVIGEVCNMPILATEGIHQSNSDTQKWFYYKAINNTEVTISRCNVTDNVSVYVELSVFADCDNEKYNVGYEWCDRKKKYSFLALKDSSYIFSWGNVGDNDLKWELTTAPVIEYGTCFDAIDAKEGMNNAPFTGGDIWYKYTAPTNGTLYISSIKTTTEDTNLEIFSDCSNTKNSSIYKVDDYYGTKQSLINRECKAGESVYICWYGDKITKAYDWELTFDREGDKPDMAIKSQIGENKRTQSKKNSQYFQFISEEGINAYEVSIPKNEQKSRKINVWRVNGGTDTGIEVKADSSKAEIFSLNRSYYIIECKNSVDDSFDWVIQKKTIDTISIGESLQGHTTFMNDWFLIDTLKTNYYALYSNNNKDIGSDFSFIKNTYYIENINEINTSNENPVFLLESKNHNLIKWHTPTIGNNNYAWSISPYQIDI